MAFRFVRWNFRNIKLHGVAEQKDWVELDETNTEIAVVSGDLVIVPHGHPHVMRDIRKTRAVYIEELLPCPDC